MRNTCNYVCQPIIIFYCLPIIVIKSFIAYMLCVLYIYMYVSIYVHTHLHTCIHTYVFLCPWNRRPVQIEQRVHADMLPAGHTCFAFLGPVPCSAHRIRQFILMMWSVVVSCVHLWGLTSEYPNSLTQVSRAYTTHLHKHLEWEGLVIFLVDNTLLVLTLVVIRKIKGIHATYLGKITRTLSLELVFHENLSSALFLLDLYPFPVVKIIINIMAFLSPTVLLANPLGCPLGPLTATLRPFQTAGAIGRQGPATDLWLLALKSFFFFFLILTQGYI